MTDLAAVIAKLRAIIKKATPRVGQDEDWRAIKSLCKSAPALLDVVEAADDMVVLWRNMKIDGMPRAERNAAIETSRQRLIDALAALAKEAADG